MWVVWGCGMCGVMLPRLLALVEFTCEVHNHVITSVAACNTLST